MSPVQAPNQLVAAWGVLGFAALLGRALYALTPLAYDAVTGSLTQLQVGLAVVWTVFMWFSEGYRAFQKQLCPRVVARANWLARNRRPLFVVFAPLFCMSLFHATRRRMLVSYAVITGVVGLVVAVRFLDQPWRGIIDLGVVVGLGWGLGSLLYLWVRAILAGGTSVDPELPEEAAA